MNSAEGSETYEQARDVCSATLNSAYKEYVITLKDKISKLNKNDKRWWTLNKELLQRKARLSVVQPLRSSDGHWHLDSKGKADLFARAFSEKSTLPPLVEDQFVAAPESFQNSFIAIRSRNVYRLLSRLNVFKATGPDKLPAKLLRMLAKELAIPVTILARRMLSEACWPEKWKTHFLVPLYKRNSVYNANNYRGVHLTPILSKVIERAIGNPLLAYLQEKGFGDRQWGFRHLTGARDLVLVCISRWISAICRGYKIGLYLGDITGAFDRVFKDYLLAKLHSVGVTDQFTDFLNAYVAPHIGTLLLKGHCLRLWN